MPTRKKPNLREVRKWLGEAKNLIKAGVIVSLKARRLREKLDTCVGEREILRWLKRNPMVIARLAHANYPHVFKEFPIGMRKPDFAVLDSFSGGWEVTFIEMEPPNARLFTKDGRPAERLAGAINQVDEWRAYVSKNLQEVLRRLSDHYGSKDLLGGIRTEPPADCRSIPLSDVQSTVYWNYIIVIGRREGLTAAENERKAEYRKGHGVEIATYDRLVSISDRLEVLPFYHY